MSPERGTGGLGNHPVVVGLTCLAAIATIIGVLIQFGSIQLPSPSFGGDDPPCEETRISLSQGRGPSGTRVVVSGSDFRVDKTVELSFHTDALPEARTDGEGRFRTEVVIPGTLDPFAGQAFDIRAHDGMCGDSNPFFLTAP